MDNFTGKIYFFKNVKYDFVLSALDKDFNNDRCEYVFIGETEELSVEFIADTAEAEIEKMEAVIKQKTIDHQELIDGMQRDVDSLRAIECDV